MQMREKLLNQRTALLDEANAILDGATAAARGLTDAEKARHDRLVADARAINALLTANAAAEREAAVTVPVSQTTAMAMHTGTMPAETPGADGAIVHPPGSPGAMAYRATRQGAPKDMRYHGFAFSEAVAGYSAALHTGTSVAAGGILIPEHVSEALWPQLEAESVSLQAGVLRMPLKNGSMLPGVNDRPRASWVNPDGEIPPSQVEFKGNKVDLKKLAALYPVANDLLRDAGDRVSAWLLDQQARALALTLDAAIFEGSGTEYAPLGVRGRSGIQSEAIATDGGDIEDLDPFIEAIGALTKANAKPTAWIMPADVWTLLMLLRETDTSLKPLLGESWNAATNGIVRKLLGIPVYPSSELSTTETEGSSGAICGSVYLGQWNQVIVAADDRIITDVDRSRLFNQDKSELRSILRADVLTPNPEAIYRLRGIKVTQ